ncbi:MAG TPA: hypothetical protein VFF16_07520 [Telluria sp.]|nr:hypothetical protein [Telluria sp.]
MQLNHNSAALQQFAALGTKPPCFAECVKDPVLQKGTAVNAK